MKKISIIGAGPGDPDLITVKGAKLIQEAEVLIWTDSLIPKQITELAPPNCEKIPTSSLTLEQIIETLIDRYNKNKKIVRLHDGDPCLYGAISEQICRLTDVGIDIEVIPGISAYQAASATLKSELTIPNEVQTIILSRAHGRTGIPENENLEKLAAIKASLCLYLSARHVKEIQATLLKHYSPSTPVAICHRISWKDEWIKIVPLSEIAKTTANQNLIRTTLYIVSPAFAIHQRRSKLYSADHSHLFRRAKKTII